MRDTKAAFMLDDLRALIRAGHPDAGVLRHVLADRLEELGEGPGLRFILRGPWGLDAPGTTVRPLFTVAGVSHTWGAVHPLDDTTSAIKFEGREGWSVRVTKREVGTSPVPGGQPWNRLRVGDAWHTAQKRACGRWLLANEPWFRAFHGEHTRTGDWRWLAFAGEYVLRTVHGGEERWSCSHRQALNIRTLPETLRLLAAKKFALPGGPR